MRAIALCLLALTIAASAAPPTDAPELAQLRASYKATVAKGARSVLQSHIANLEKLRDIYTRGSNLAGAAKVQGDIDRANVAMASGEFLPPAADASNAPAPELDKLRSGHDADVQRTLKPYQEAYMRELGKLRDNYTRAANLAGATAVQEEIDNVKPGGEATVGAEKFFVNKSWYSMANAEYQFEKSGKGVRTYNYVKVPFTWRKLDTGIIEVAGRNTPAGPQIMWYFKFDNKKTALFGTTTNDLSAPLRADK